MNCKIEGAVAGPLNNYASTRIALSSCGKVKSMKKVVEIVNG
jgi:hypothetical protein